MKVKKIFVILLTSLVFVVNIFAADYIKVADNNVQSKTHFELLSSDIKTSKVHFVLNGFYKTEINTVRGEAWLLRAPGNGALTLEKGAPELPLFATSLIIPGKAEMDVKIVSAKYKDYQNVLIAPSKGNLLRTVNPDDIPYEFGDVYSQDAFYPSQLGKLRSPYIIRDFRGQALVVQPFRYNPVTKTLRVYYDVVLEVKQTGTSKINVLDNTKKPEKIDVRFKNIYSRHFLNYGYGGSRYTPVDEHGNMLIICYGDFMTAMQPYVDWKIQTGTPVEMVDVATVGNTSSQIKQYITNYYNQNGLTFVLLVGDAPQVHSSVIGGNDSDNDYTYVSGNDHYPDLLIGRFSAETVDHVNTMVQRTLNYEKNPPSDTAWYTKAIGIGSDQGPGDDGEYDYEHIRNIGNNKLLPFTYNYAYEFFDGNQGGNDAPGNPTPTMISDAINSGATIINYCGHGSTTSWGTSGFNNNNINNLVNDNHLPFIFSVACVNGNFVNNTCFAEAWLRATHNGEPTGAIATIMSTINQSWNPPMCGQDEMDDILVETYSNNIKRTYSGIALNGCMEMNDEYGSDGEEMTDTWTVFGDPSVIIRTAAPQDMTVTAPDELYLNDTSMTISTNATEGTACLSLDGVILGTAQIDSTGNATITFAPLTTMDTADFVITSFNFRPHIVQIPIVNNIVPYLELTDVEIDDANGNGQLDYHEFADLTLSLANTGFDTAKNILTTVSITNRYVSLPDSTEYYGDILIDDTVTIPDGYQIHIADSVTDMALAIFQVKSVDTVSGDFWTNSFGRLLHAPKLQYVGFEIDDSGANGNGRIDPGETVDIVTTVKNAGTSDAYNVIVQLSTLYPYLTIANSQQSIGDLNSKETKTVTFQVTATGDAPDGSTAFFDVNIVADYNRSAAGNFYTNIGLKPLAIIKLADEEPSADSMVACLQNLEIGCEVLSAIPENTSDYKSLFVLLGTFPNNHVLTDSEGQQLADFLNNGGRVYMEGADTWAQDDATPVHPMFHIDGIDDGLGDLYRVDGLDDGIMYGLSFKFEGNNNYIDHIAADDSSILIFENPQANNRYGVGVSFENGLYKTVGLSFEFAGLADSLGNGKEIVMARILSFFNVPIIWTDIKTNEDVNFDASLFPNPFNKSLNISVNIEKESALSVSLYDISGRKIAVLFNGKADKGENHIVWNRGNNNLKKGLYFVRISTENKTVTKKLIFTGN